MTDQKTTTKKWLDKFQIAIDDFDEKSLLDEGYDPVIIQAQKNALISMRDDLQEQLDNFNK